MVSSVPPTALAHNCLLNQVNTENYQGHEHKSHKTPRLCIDPNKHAPAFSYTRRYRTAMPLAGNMGT